MDKGQGAALYAFGSNGNGQLGIASVDDTSSPQSVHFSSTTNINIVVNNSLSSSPQQHDNNNKDSTTRPHVNAITPFHDFAAGGNHTALITHGSRQLFMTGSNKDGETLLQESCQVFKPAELSKRLQHQQPQQPQQQQQLNKDQDQNQDQENSGRSADMNKDSNSNIQWRSVACGWAFTIGLTEPYHPVPDSHNTIAVSRSNNNVNQSVYAWGSGSFGELGLGPGRFKTGGQAIPITTGLLDPSSGTRFELVKVKAGLRHVLLLAKEIRFPNDQGIADGATRTVLMGWGSNRQGQLGVLARPGGSGRGDPTTVAPMTEKELRGKFMEPTRIVISATTRQHNSSGTATPVTRAADEEPEILDMACGQSHSLVLFSNGTVFSSGLDKYGQLGPRALISAEDSSEEGGMEKSKKVDFRIGFEQVLGLPFVDSVSCGWNHNAAMDTRPIADDPTAMTIIYLWGRNDHGQLGGGIPYHAVNACLIGGVVNVPTGIVQVRIPVRRKDGSGGKEESGNKEGSVFESLVSYSCGSEHTLVTTQSGACYAWGWNEHGNCGGGVDSDGNKDLEDVSAPRLVQFPNRSVSLSTGHGGWVSGGYGSSWVWT
ncbi:hypothetical protein BG015_011983 [Linnemannia schmuckeri]|uniref:Uncharacterized protein n=1 Tax=Linnemannia schmuckeri TaxID=64567 RepID=A0A9P5RVB1_9FUNG|nr:hypothetical protein BG015_011983 [Linnemannia schmuckeri]